MDDQSVVEYFERFAAHAFGDTSSVITTCVLVGPDKRTHPCSFCFTIKRDVFDIPMMSISPPPFYQRFESDLYLVVGNFLPILS